MACAPIICAQFQGGWSRFSGAMLKTSTTHIKKIVFIQFTASLMAGVFCWLVFPAWGLSVFSGAVIASLSNVYFAWKVFSKQKETKSSQILTTYYGAEVGKMILTVMLFIAAFNLVKPLNVIALMSAYLFITIIPVLASFFFNDDDTNWRNKNVE